MVRDALFAFVIAIVIVLLFPTPLIVLPFKSKVIAVLMVTFSVTSVNNVTVSPSLAAFNASSKVS